VTTAARLNHSQPRDAGRYRIQEKIMVNAAARSNSGGPFDFGFRP
jgi:hypothetical protein